MNRGDRELLGELGRLNQTVGKFVLTALNGLDAAPPEDVHELGTWLVQLGSALQERARLAEAIDGVVIEIACVRPVPPLYPVRPVCAGWVRKKAGSHAILTCGPAPHRSTPPPSTLRPC